MPDDPRTRMNSVVIETISSMEIEEISEVLEDMTAYKIIQCKERIPSSVAEYGQVKESIKKAYLDQWYEDYLEDLVQTAEVEINERVYSKEFIAKLG